MTNLGPHSLPAGLDLVRVLGYGSSGTVLLASQRSLDRLVAVKVIQTVAPPSVVARLRREARVLASLKHERILPVYQLHEDPGSLALVMRFERHGDLRSTMAALTGSQRIGVLRDVASALDAAHQKGVVHRDLKPANILSDENGRAVLADFGLARLPRNTDAFRTVGHIVTGTPLYLAPEQIREPQLEAPAIDHYAFGVLAYELLTGWWPYPDPTWSTVDDLHLHASPISPQARLPGLDAAVSAALVGLLHKESDGRLHPSDLLRAADEVPQAGWDALIPGVARGAGPARAGVDTETGVASHAVPKVDHEPMSSRGPVRLQPQQESSTPVEVPPAVTAHWIEPPVFRPERRSRLPTRLAALVIGLVLGVSLFLILVGL